jgi:hypothetical protein
MGDGKEREADGCSADVCLWTQSIARSDRSWVGFWNVLRLLVAKTGFATKLDAESSRSWIRYDWRAFIVT